MKLNLFFLSWILALPLWVSADPVFTHTYPDATKLFYTEVKVDEALPYGGARGKDVALRNGYGYGGDADDINWFHYDGNHNLHWFKHTFDWTLSRTNTQTTFTFGDTTLTADSLAGDWDALGIYFNTSGWHGHIFDKAYIELSLNSWNDETLKNPLQYRSSLGQTRYLELYDEEYKWIESLSGTATFHWDVKDWAFYNKSPNGRLGFYLKGFDYNNVDFESPVASIPIDDTGSIGDATNVPAPLISLAALVGLFTLLRRRGR